MSKIKKDNDAKHKVVTTTQRQHNDDAKLRRLNDAKLKNRLSITYIIRFRRRLNTTVQPHNPTYYIIR